MDGTVFHSSLVQNVTPGAGVITSGSKAPACFQILQILHFLGKYSYFYSHMKIIISFSCELCEQAELILLKFSLKTSM